MPLLEPARDSSDRLAHLQTIAEAESSQNLGLAREVALLSEGSIAGEKDLIAKAPISKARITQSLDPSFPVFF
jgi:hypothetical protein